MASENRVAGPSISPLAQDTDTPMFTPRSSTSLSPKMPASLAGPSPDVPIPSVELPAFGLSELPGTSTVLDAFTRMNLTPSINGSGHFQFGQEKELSPFTFRRVHNITPEPTVHVDQAATPNILTSSGPGTGLGSEDNRFVSMSGAKQPSVVHARANIAPPPSTKLQASSAPVQPPVHNQPSKPARYDIQNEIPPNEPYFDKDFQRALLAGKSVALQIFDILGTCELARDRESQVHSIVQTANELSRFDAPSVCKIGIVGDSGVGMWRE